MFSDTLAADDDADYCDDLDEYDCGSVHKRRRQRKQSLRLIGNLHQCPWRKRALYPWRCRWDTSWPCGWPLTPRAPVTWSKPVARGERWFCDTETTSLNPPCEKKRIACQHRTLCTMGMEVWRTNFCNDYRSFG